VVTRKDAFKAKFNNRYLTSRKWLSVSVLALLAIASISMAFAQAGNGNTTQSTKRPLVVASFIPQNGNDPNFLQFVVPQPTIDAIMERYDWSALNPVQGVFDFTQVDSDIAKWRALGKQTVVLVSLVSDSVGPQSPNTATPAWVLKQVPQVTCTFIAPNKIPVMYDQKVMAFTQPFIVALLQHLDTQAPSVAYVRVGMFLGGENCPLCKNTLPAGETTALNYLQQMSSYIRAHHPTGTRLVENCSACFAGTSYDLQSGNILGGQGLGLGQEDLSASDVQGNKAGTCSWCNVFNAHPRAFKYLQAACDLSKPGCPPQPSSAFPTYFPFAETFNVDAVELPTTPVLALAYVPNYKAPDGGTYNQFHQQYQNALAH